MGKKAPAIAAAAFVSALLVGGGLALASTSDTPTGDSPEPTVSVVDNTTTTAPTTTVTTTEVATSTAEVPAAPVVPAPAEVAPPAPPVDTQVVTQPAPQPQPEQQPFDPGTRPTDQNGEWLLPLPPPSEAPAGPPNHAGEEQPGGQP